MVQNVSAMTSENNLLNNGIQLNEAAIGHLSETAGWAKFLSVLGFIYSGCIAIAGLVAGFAVSGLGGNYALRSSRVTQGGVMALLYIAGASILFFTCLQLFRYSKKITQAINLSNPGELENACQHLKLYFKLAGVIAIIALIITGFAIAGLFIAATFSRY
jgi:hypothetical protein